MSNSDFSAVTPAAIARKYALPEKTVDDTAATLQAALAELKIAIETAEFSAKPAVYNTVYERLLQHLQSSDRQE